MPRYGDEKKRTYLKCRPRRVIPHCLDVCNEFAYVFECGHSRFSAVLLAASQFIYAAGINVSYAVSIAAKNYVCTATFNGSFVWFTSANISPSFSNVMFRLQLFVDILDNFFKMIPKVKIWGFKCVSFKKESLREKSHKLQCNLKYGYTLKRN